MEGIESCVTLLKEWLLQQPHLPKKIPDRFLKKCLVASNYSTEIAKTLIDLFFTAHSHIPDVFSNRNLNTQEVQDTLEIFDMLDLPKMVENSKISIIRLKSGDIDKYDCQASLKTYLMFDDITLYTDDRIYDGEILIVDLEKSSLQLLTKISFTLVKKIVDYVQQSRPTNLKRIHFVHTPPFVEKLMIFLKPIVKSEIMNMINLHPTPDTLSQFLSKDVLPKEYGGTGKTIEDYSKEWKASMFKNKFLIEEENNWKVDEGKRPDERSYGDKFGLQGSFRTLDID